MVVMLTVWVSTHSRLKAAGVDDAVGKQLSVVSTHSRLKAAGIVTIVKQ